MAESAAADNGGEVKSGDAVEKPLNHLAKKLSGEEGEAKDNQREYMVLQQMA
jgi:hypothetical protein